LLLLCEKSGLTTKRKEYFRVSSLRHYLLIDSETPSVLLYTRDANQTWPKDPQSFTDPKATIPLTALKLSLKLKDLYHQIGLLLALRRRCMRGPSLHMPTRPSSQ